MKKLFTIIFIVMAVIVINGCGSSSKFANDPFVGQGHGEAITKNVAREKAYNEAVAEISRKYNVEVNENSQRMYSSNDRTKGKTSEALDYKSVVNTRTQARLGDVVIKRERTRRFGKKWFSDMTVVISPDNIE